jgi:UDP-2-acetamido-2,6-beta-L-arabino-hexul-4-ose reductase
MKRVLVTGSSGFIGKNLVVALRRRAGIEVNEYEIEDGQEHLEEIISGGVDVIYHLAGINRPKDESEYVSGNVDLTATVASLVKLSAHATRIVFASSTQAELDNPYGTSKREAENVLRHHGSDTGLPVAIYRLPNVFGKWSKPDYNSVVATFCHRAARGLELIVEDPAKVLTFVYIDDVVEEFARYIDCSEQVMHGVERQPSVSPSYPIKLGELADRIRSFRVSSLTGVLPSFDEPFDRYLYGTYLSFLNEKELEQSLLVRRDERGWLVEVLKSRSFGQVFFSETKPGVSRGNHYHDSKAEKFYVVRGEALIRLERLTDGRTVEYRVSGAIPSVVDIPPGYVHSITNVGASDLLTLFWADEIFDPVKADTYPGRLGN